MGGRMEQAPEHGGICTADGTILIPTVQIKVVPSFLTFCWRICPFLDYLRLLHSKYYLIFHVLICLQNLRKKAYGFFREIGTFLTFNGTPYICSKTLLKQCVCYPVCLKYSFSLAKNNCMYNFQLYFSSCKITLQLLLLHWVVSGTQTHTWHPHVAGPAPNFSSSFDSHTPWNTDAHNYPMWRPVSCHFLSESKRRKCFLFPMENTITLEKMWMSNNQWSKARSMNSFMITNNVTNEESKFFPINIKPKEKRLSNCEAYYSSAWFLWTWFHATQTPPHPTPNPATQPPAQRHQHTYPHLFLVARAMELTPVVSELGRRTRRQGSFL